MNGMISGHDRPAAGKTDYSLMRQQYLLHQLFLRGITSSAIAKIVL